MKTNEPIKHHCVPQSYLKFFAKQKKDDYILYVFDKKSGTEYYANVSNAAEIRNYNKVNQGRFIVPTPNGDALYYESKYNELIEGRIPQIIGNLVCACTLCNLKKTILTNQMKQELARLIIIQWLRTPQYRQRTYDIGIPICNDLISGMRNQIKTISDLDRKKEFFKTLDEFEYNEDFVKSVHLSSTTDEDRINRFCEFLVHNRSWVIYENKLYKSIPFVTSDTPVIMADFQSGNIGIKNNGLEQPYTVISMPLTPKYSVSLYHKSCVFGYYSESYEDKCVPIDEIKFILNQNFLQSIQCTRQVYTTPDVNNILIKNEEENKNA